mgnify:FL=1
MHPRISARRSVVQMERFLRRKGLGATVVLPPHAVAPEEFLGAMRSSHPPPFAWCAECGPRLLPVCGGSLPDHPPTPREVTGHPQLGAQPRVGQNDTGAHDH